MDERLGTTPAGCHARPGVCGFHTGVTYDDGAHPVLQPRQGAGQWLLAPQGSYHWAPTPGPGRGCTGGAGLTQGRGGRWAAGGPRALIPSSCRFPQIDSLLTFFSAAGSAAQIDGAASPAPLSFLSLLLISTPINQPPLSSRGQVLPLPRGLMLSQGPPEHKLLTVITPTLEAPRHLLLAGQQGPSLPVITARMLASPWQDSSHPRALLPHSARHPLHLFL